MPDGQAIGRQAGDALVLDPPDAQALDMPDGQDPPPVRRRKPTPQQRARLIAEQEARVAEAGRPYQQVRARSQGANGKLPPNYQAALERGLTRSRAERRARQPNRQDAGLRETSNRGLPKVVVYQGQPRSSRLG